MRKTVLPIAVLSLVGGLLGASVVYWAGGVGGYPAMVSDGAHYPTGQFTLPPLSTTNPLGELQRPDDDQTHPPDYGTVLVAAFYRVLLGETAPTIELERSLFIFNKDHVRARLINARGAKEDDPVLLQTCLEHRDLFLPMDIRSMKDYQRPSDARKGVGSIVVTTTFYQAWAPQAHPGYTSGSVIVVVSENNENRRAGHKDRTIVFHVTGGKIQLAATHLDGFGGPMAAERAEFGKGFPP